MAEWIRRRDAMLERYHVNMQISKAKERQKFYGENDVPKDGICYYCHKQIYLVYSAGATSCPHCFARF